MNTKQIIRIVIGLIVAAIGTWQLKSPSTQPRDIYERPQQSQNTKPDNHKRSQTQEAGVVGDFDYYLVSLSWSPAYCQSHPQDKRQCGGRGFGFVLHGVWPQKLSGGYPEDCPASSQPSSATVQRTLAFMPSEKLINHEWTKHGTCTGLSADEYFALADKAFAVLKQPTLFQAPEQSRNVSADQILSEFVAANTGIGRDSLAVKCSGGELEEVRLCVNPQLKPIACGKGVRTQCGRETVLVRSMR